MERENLLKNKKKFKEQGKLDLLASVCKSLGSLYYLEGNFEEALKQYKEEEQLWKSLGQEIKVGVANRMIGEVYGSLENHTLALKHQKIHLDIAKKHNDMIEQQRAWATIGRTYFLKADFISDHNKQEYEIILNKAKKAYITSLDICNSLKGISQHEQAEMKARLLLNLGLVIECQGDISVALEHLEKATQICKNQDLWEDLFRCYNASGGLLFRQKETARALTQLNLAIATAQRLDQRASLQCEAFRTQAQIHFSLADWTAAKRVLKRAYRLRTPVTEDRSEVERLLKIAVILCRTQESLLSTSETDYASRKQLYERMGDGATALNNYKKAIEYYSKMLENAELSGDSGINLAPCYISLSQTFKDDHQYRLALEYARKELALYEDDNPVEACRTLLSIEQLEELEGATYSELESILNKAKRLAETSGVRRLQVTVWRAILLTQRAHCSSDIIEETESTLRSLGVNPDNSSDSESEKAYDGEEENTQAIGDSVCLDALTDSETEDLNESENHPILPVTEDRPRRVAKTFRIKRNEKGETALHSASINGNLPLVQRLLNQGHPVNARDFCGWTPLHEACNHGHVTIAEALLNAGARIDDPGGEQCDGTTPLHDAASCGNLDVISLLLSRGASPLLKNNNGDTPLELLVQWRRRVKDNSFTASDDSYYEEIYNKLKNSLIRVGISTYESQNEIYSHEDEDEDEEEEEETDKLMTKRISPSFRKRQKDSEILPRLNLRRSQDVENSSSSEEEDRGIRYSEVESSRHDTSDAVEEYQKAITVLRTRKISDSPFPIQKSNIPPKRGSLLEENEVGEDWLEDDLENIQRPAKKRRTATSTLGMDLIEKQGMRRSWKPKQSKALSPISPTNNINIPDNSESSPPPMDIVNEMLSVQNLDFPNIITKQPLNVNQVKSNRPRSTAHQSSLLEAGFSRDVQSTSIALPPQTIPIKPIKVRVQDKLLLVAISNPETMTIRQLADGAAERYYKVEGLRPSLAIVTSDGALISEDDPVSLLLGSEEVIAQVQSWELAPIHKRYIDACRLQNRAVNNTIQSCLEASQATHEIELNGLILNELDLEPVLKSINYQGLLQSIDLSGNNLGNYGLKLLSRALPTLSQLQKLNLSSTNITSEGICYLSDIVTKSSQRILETFTNLDLSFNYLGNNSMEHLITFLRSISLKYLNLAACDIITLDQSTLPFYSLEELNISYNPLSQDSLRSILNSLNLKRLISLDVSATNAKRELISSFELMPPDSLRTLKLDSCQLTDNDLYNLLKTLNCCLDLGNISLCNNPGLSSISLRRLLEREPALTSLSATGCSNIHQYQEDSVHSNWFNPENRRLRSIRLHVNKASGESFQRNLIEMWRKTWNDLARIEVGLNGLLKMNVAE